MAIIAKCGEKPNEIKDFPKLMKRKKNKYFNRNLIVYFSSSKVGMAIVSDHLTFGKGYYSDDWNMEVFEDYNGPVTLQNA